MKKFAHLQRRKPSIVDESNHDGAEQESFSEKERLVWMEITFTLRKNGGRSFPVVRQAGRLANRKF